MGLSVESVSVDHVCLCPVVGVQSSSVFIHGGGRWVLGGWGHCSTSSHLKFHCLSWSGPVGPATAWRAVNQEQLLMRCHYSLPPPLITDLDQQRIPRTYHPTPSYHFWFMNPFKTSRLREGFHYRLITLFLDQYLDKIQQDDDVGEKSIFGIFWETNSYEL